MSIPTDSRYPAPGYLKQANRAFERGAYTEAIRLYEQAIVADCRLTTVVTPSIRRAETRLHWSGRTLPKRRFVLWPSEAPPHGKLEIINGTASTIPAAPTVLVVGHAAGRRLFGAERSLLDIVRAAHEGSNCNVIVSLPSRNPVYIRALAPYAIRILVHQYETWQKRSPVAGRWVDQFCRIIEQFEIGLVHVNTIMLREPLIAAKACRKPALAHAREIIGTDTHLQNIIGFSGRLVVQHIRQLSFRLISNSLATQRALDPDGRGYVLPNSIDAGNFSRHVQRRDRFDHETADALVIGLISSNLPKKGLADFLRLAALCVEQRVNVRFLAIGPRTRYARSLKRSPEFRRLRNIRFTGYIADPAVAVARIQVICNFSNVPESFGRTVLEGMAGGRPAVVYDHGALPELVEDRESGFVIPFAKPQAAVPILQALADDRGYLRKLGENARERAARNFGQAQYARSSREIYENVFRHWQIPRSLSELHRNE